MTKQSVVSGLFNKMSPEKDNRDVLQSKTAVWTSYQCLLDQYQIKLLTIDSAVGALSKLRAHMKTHSILFHLKYCCLLLCHFFKLFLF